MTHARRLRVSRTSALLAALALPVSLAACTDAGYPAPARTTTAHSTAGAPSSSATTSGPPSSAPSAQPVAAEMPEQAAAIAARILTAAVGAVGAGGAEGKAARAAAFSGSALTAANAQNTLLGTLTAAEKDNAVLSDAEPVVVAISQGAAYPRAILVKTTRRASGFPLLTLLLAPDEAQGYRVAAWATLLTGATLGGFPDLEAGSPLVTSAAAAGATVDPILADYAASLAFPAPPLGERAFAEDSFATAVRQAAQAQADALGSAGSVSQHHEYQGVLAAFRLGAGQGSVVFAQVDRTDVLKEKTSNALTPSKAFTALSGKSIIDTQATEQTVEYLLVRFPVSDKAVVLGAAQQLYAASGS